ncbi:MAG: flagellar assembly protein FliW [Cellulosilyticaceae bacterium]
MKLTTKNFGTLDFDETKKIIFQEGIPGLKHLTEYILIEDEDTESPFAYLQSIQDGDISFVVASPYGFKANYTIHIKDNIIEQLGGGKEEDIKVLCIITVPNSFEAATINLVAPLIINQDTRCGMQVILEDRQYTTRHKLVDLLQERS